MLLVGGGRAINRHNFKPMKRAGARFEKGLKNAQKGAQESPSPEMCGRCANPLPYSAKLLINHLNVVADVLIHSHIDPSLFYLCCVTVFNWEGWSKVIVCRTWSVSY